LQCLSDIEPTLQGNTTKQQNPYPQLPYLGQLGLLPVLVAGLAIVLKGLLVCLPLLAVPNALRLFLPDGFCLILDLCVYGSFPWGGRAITKNDMQSIRPTLNLNARVQNNLGC